MDAAKLACAADDDEKLRILIACASSDEVDASVQRVVALFERQVANVVVEICPEGPIHRMTRMRVWSGPRRLYPLEAS